MPRKNNWFAIVTLTAICWFAGLSTHVTAATTGGITVAPATFTLALPSGQTEVQQSFSITNHYTTAITLNLSFTQSVKTPGGNQNILKQLSVTPNQITIPAGSSVKPIVTFTDDSAIPPGSQDVDLTITEAATPGNTIAVVTSIHMPIILIKEAGAVTKLSAMVTQTSRFTLMPPKMATTTIQNTGNIVAIPRGYVTITNNSGHIFEKGVMNTGSIALVPGDQARFNTTLTQLDRAWMPGTYHMHVTYGIGGNSPTTTISTNFFYIPLWELLIILPIAALIYCCYLFWMEWRVRHILQRLQHEEKGKK